MIKHIVMWRLHPQAAGKSKADNARELNERLQGLPEKIPQIRFLEVGINLSPDPAAADVVLYSEFDSMEDLRAYQTHPEHQELIRFLNVIRSEKRVVDYPA